MLKIMNKVHTLKYSISFLILINFINNQSVAQTIAEYKNHIAKTDLFYNKPVTRSEEGMPVGNGKVELLEILSQRGSDCKLINP
ncbi:MAG: hypothetical protein Q7T72_12095 [Bacteroidales bacterium]|nr:hypothetical protein [Bacteroidales bacterium]MDP3001530.1 hypothetical protein [Bacteroidales bacterium]